MNINERRPLAFHSLWMVWPTRPTVALKRKYKFDYQQWTILALPSSVINFNSQIAVG